MAHLSPCPSCARHVRVTSVVCPFCAHVLPETFAALTARPAPVTRLSRAATYALGAAIATGSAMLPGCGPQHVVDHGSQVDIYGGPPEPPQPQPPPAQLQPSPPSQPPAQQTQPPPPPADPSQMVQAYGAPPPEPPVQQPQPPPPQHQRPHRPQPPPDPGEMRPLYGVPPEK